MTPLATSSFLKKFLLLIFVFALTGVGNAKADVAPPEPPSGTNPLPGSESTNVRMLAETVLVEIDGDSPSDTGTAAVTATFTMHNMGDADEQMQVRFPLDQTTRWGKLCEDPAPLFSPITDLTVKVNGQPVPTQETYQTITYEGLFEGIEGVTPPPPLTIPCWSNFPVTFPAGQDVNIEVKYTTEPYHDAEGAYAYAYVLETGAGWKGTIGSADIIYRLPYPVDASNFYSCSPESCEIEDQSVKWHFEDFEPSSNLAVFLLPPPLWQTIKQEKENISRDPKDGEAWGRLGKAYKEAIIAKRGFRGDAAGLEMYRLSKEAYTQATSLLPKDADWHYGFAELLCIDAEWNSYFEENNTQNWQECMSQLKQALDINPNHEKAKEELQYLSQFNGLVDLSGSQPDYLILTPQPTATVTPTPSQIPTDNLQEIRQSTEESPQNLQGTREPVAAPTIIISPTPAAAKSKTTGTLLDLTIVLLLVLLVFGIIRYRKR